MTTVDGKDQIRMLCNILDQLSGDEAELRNLAAQNSEKVMEMCFAPISAGHFYAFDFKTHAIMLFYLAGLTDHLNEFAANPCSLEQFVTETPPDVPEWMIQEDKDIREK